MQKKKSSRQGSKILKPRLGGPGIALSPLLQPSPCCGSSLCLSRSGTRARNDHRLRLGILPFQNQARVSGKFQCQFFQGCLIQAQPGEPGGEGERCPRATSLARSYPPALWPVGTPLRLLCPQPGASQLQSLGLRPQELQAPAGAEAEDSLAQTWTGPKGPSFLPPPPAAIPGQGLGQRGRLGSWTGLYGDSLLQRAQPPPRPTTAQGRHGPGDPTWPGSHQGRLPGEGAI